MYPPHLKAVWCVLAMLALGCDDDSEPAAMDASTHLLDANLGGQTDGEVSWPDAGGGMTSPLVLVSEREGPDDAIQYLHVLPDFPADQKLDTRNAVELGSYVVTHSGDGAIWVYQPEGATMQKYVVDAQLAVKPDVKISFAAYGVSGYDPDVVWVSPERAFLVDETSAQIIAWNPRAMTIALATPIDPAILTRNGLKLQLQQGAVVVGGRAFMSANWRNWETNDYVPGAAFAWFDTSLDAPTVHIVHEDRCAASVDAPFVDEAGDVYIIGDAALGFDVLANPKKSALPQCVRRVRAGQAQFDPDFFVDLQAVTGSPGFRDSHPMGMGKILLNLWSPSLNVADYVKPSPEWYWELSAVFEYMIVDLPSKVATPVSSLPRAAAQFSTTLRVDGRNYVQSYRPGNGVVVSRVGPDASVVEVLELGMGTDLQYIGRL